MGTKKVRMGLKRVTNNSKNWGISHPQTWEITCPQVKNKEKDLTETFSMKECIAMVEFEMMMCHL